MRAKELADKIFKFLNFHFPERVVFSKEAKLEQLEAEHCRDYVVMLRCQAEKAEALEAGIAELRNMIWGDDIAHPSCPEYEEWHAKCTKFMAYIDSHLLKEQLAVLKVDGEFGQCPHCTRTISHTTAPGMCTHCYSPVKWEDGARG